MLIILYAAFIIESMLNFIYICFNGGLMGGIGGESQSETSPRLQKPGPDQLVILYFAEIPK